MIEDAGLIVPEADEDAWAAALAACWRTPPEGLIGRPGVGSSPAVSAGIARIDLEFFDELLKGRPLSRVGV